MNLETTLTAELIDKYKSRWPNKTIVDYLKEAAGSQPDKTAIKDGRSSYTFRELSNQVDRVALGLKGLGVVPDDVVSFQLPNWNEFVILHFAVTRLGAISNPLIPIYRDEQIDYMVKAAKSKVMVIPDEFGGFDFTAMVDRLRYGWPDMEHVLVIGDKVPEGMESFRKLMDEPWEERDDTAELDLLYVDPNDVTEIVFTSGTTGEPKGVMHTHNSLCVSTEYFKERLNVTSDDVVFMASTFAHQTGFLYGARIQVHCGCTAIYQDKWDASEFLHKIEQDGVSVTMAATPYLSDAVNVDGIENRDLSSFRAFCTAGAPVPPSLVREAAEKLPCTILTGWGQSENGLVALTYLDDSEDKLTNTAGYPCPGMELTVVDLEGNPCKRDTEGDLWCRGPAMFVGYLDRIPFTREQYVGDWFKTGDRAVMDTDGYIRLAGRSSDIIRHHGEQVPVTKLENLLHEHPDIAVAQVVAMPDPDDPSAEVGCAFVSLRGAKSGSRAGHGSESNSLSESGWSKGSSNESVNGSVNGSGNQSSNESSGGATIGLQRTSTSQSFTIDKMREFLRNNGIRQQDWPERLEVVDDFPRTPSGKIQKFVLRKEIQKKLEQEGILPG